MGRLSEFTIKKGWLIKTVQKSHKRWDFHVKCTCGIDSNCQCADIQVFIKKIFRAINFLEKCSTQTLEAWLLPKATLKHRLTSLSHLLASSAFWLSWVSFGHITGFLDLNVFCFFCFFLIVTIALPAGIQFHLKTQINRSSSIKFPFVWAGLRERCRAWQDVWLLSCAWPRGYFGGLSVLFENPPTCSRQHVHSRKWAALLTGRKIICIYFMCFGKREC